MDFISNINLETVFYGNTVFDYIKSVGVFIVLVIVFKLVQFVILRRLGKLAKKTKTDIDDTLIAIVRSLKPQFYYFIAFYFAVRFLSVNTFAEKIIGSALIIWIVYQIIIGIQILIDYVLHQRIAKDKDKGTKAAVGYLNKIAKATLWIAGVLIILSNLGVNITSVIAGLGIGGVAIAFALQNILSDLFSSFAIYFDKPFSVGDFIIVGEQMGVVEKIGIKTTRLRALQGEEIVIANNELTSSRVQNFKRMEKRRIVFTIGVTYNTPSDKLKKIPDIVKNIIGAMEHAQIDRVHFKKFGDFSLNYEVVYYILSPDYITYMDTQQAINLALVEAFEREGIDFAYPTQSIILKKEG
jgi:small-conductance mechanosensitive channel